MYAVKITIRVSAAQNAANWSLLTVSAIEIISSSAGISQVTQSTKGASTGDLPSCTWNFWTSESLLMAA